MKTCFRGLPVSDGSGDTGSPSHTQRQGGQGQLVQCAPGQDLLRGLQQSERPPWGGRTSAGLGRRGAGAPASEVSLPWLHPLMPRDVRPGSAGLCVSRGFLVFWASLSPYMDVQVAL